MPITYLRGMEVIRLSKPDRTLQGVIALEGSKSLSNRALIILALAGADPGSWLNGLSTARDTQTLLRLLQHPTDRYDAGDAGTTFRFLTAYLALQPGTQELTGSARMCERPIGALVEALRSLGSEITCLVREGFPPLRIGPPNFSGKSRQTVQIDAGVSSQFLSALLLIGPYLPGGLELIPEGRLVSRPYLDMTLRMMQYFGIEAAWEGDHILVQPGRYQARKLYIEADWSAASYWFAMAAFAENVDLKLEGLYQDSWQGDRVIGELLFGPTPSPSPQGEGGIPSGYFRIGEKDTPDIRRPGLIYKEEQGFPSITLKFNRGNTPLPLGGGVGADLRSCPDLAQTLAIAYAGLGIPTIFIGLETLAIKETDRTAALGQELAKVGVYFGPEAPGSDRFVLHGKAQWDRPPRFATYGDHRMAMALACLAMLGPVEIENPEVVVKSYPAFWEHLAQVGFILEKIREA